MPSFICPDCKTTINGTNCAHELSRLLGLKNKAGCVAVCPCEYPVRAKEMRSNIFSGYIDSDRKSTVNAFIYCETATGGGHVYYGTYDTVVKGNGLSASKMSSVAIFERYSTAS